MNLKPLLIGVVDYLLGFLALSVFAALAFGAGVPTDERMLWAFKVAGGVAALELAVLWRRAAPSNRLIVGANVWLLAAAIAAWLQQWWWLRGYQQLGEASLFLVMLGVGLVTTVCSPMGFIAAPGPRQRVRQASLLLLLGVVVALGAAVHFRGQLGLAAVAPVITLSWLNRLLRRWVQWGTASMPASPHIGGVASFLTKR